MASALDRQHSNARSVPRLAGLALARRRPAGGRVRPGLGGLQTALVTARRPARRHHLQRHRAQNLLCRTPMTVGARSGGMSECARQEGLHIGPRPGSRHPLVGRQGRPMRSICAQRTDQPKVVRLQERIRRRPSAQTRAGSGREQRGQIAEHALPQITGPPAAEPRRTAGYATPSLNSGATGARAAQTGPYRADARRLRPRPAACRAAAATVPQGSVHAGFYPHAGGGAPGSARSGPVT